MKKTLHILALISAIGTLMPVKVDAPALEKIVESSNFSGNLNNLSQIEISLKDFPAYINPEKFYEKFDVLMNKKIKEEMLYKTDKIYCYIDNVYKNFEVPSYINKNFARSLILIESGDDPLAKGKHGERGLGQLTKEAWNKVEKNTSFEKGAFNPEKNIEVTIKYLLWLDEQFRNSHRNWHNLKDEEKRKMIISAYNGGIYRLKNLNWRISKMPEGTKNHIRKIEKVMDEKFNF
jgi:hypothetical protein